MTSMELDQTGLSETDAASAANKNGKVIAKEDEDSSENDEELYNVEDEEDIDAAILETQAQIRELERVALKEMLTANGHALRGILKSERVKAHYVSPFSEENTMSIEDILLEIPKEDLHEVGMIRDRVFMTASFVQKWIIPTIRVRNALRNNVPGQAELKRQCCFRFSTNRPWI